MNFSTIWTIEPPPIVTGITEPKKEIKGEFVLLDDFGADSDEEAVEGEDSAGSGGDESAAEEEEERESASLESGRDEVASSAGRSSVDGPRTKW